MSKLISRKLLGLEEELVPIIFTKAQFEIIKKKVENKELSYNEKMNLYRSINKKLNVISKINNHSNCFLRGKEDILEKRIDLSLKLLKKIERNHKGQKIIISGSYLWNENYNDIDVFIISKYNKEDYNDGNIHYNYINDTDNIFFSSINKISVSNFEVGKDEFNFEVDDLISIYQELIIYMTQGKDCKQELRDFIIGQSFLTTQTVLNSKQLNTVFNKMNIRLVNEMMINALLFNINEELKKDILLMIKNNEELYNEYKTDNLKIYNNTFKRVLEIA